MVYLDRPLAAWRMWEGQGSTDARMMLRSANQVRSKYFPELGQVGDRYAEIWWASAARRYLSAGNRVQASKHFLQAGATQQGSRSAGLCPGRLGGTSGGGETPPAHRTSTGPGMGGFGGALA